MATRAVDPSGQRAKLMALTGPYFDRIGVDQGCCGESREVKDV
jgi:hypothetical protein